METRKERKPVAACFNVFPSDGLVSFTKQNLQTSKIYQTYITKCLLILVLCPSLPLTLHNFLVGKYICIFATSLIYFVSIIKSIYICQEWPDHSETCYDVVLVNVQECSLFFKGTTETNDYANFGI